MGPAADTTGILVPTMTSSPYLDAVRDRVVIFDGAAGTWLQQQDLSMEDYGTPELEGCPEILNETRPELIAQMKEEMNLTDEQFDELITRAMDELPQEYIRGLQNVAIVMADEPDDAQKTESFDADGLNKLV